MKPATVMQDTDLSFYNVAAQISRLDSASEDRFDVMLVTLMISFRRTFGIMADYSTADPKAQEEYLFDLIKTSAYHSAELQPAFNLACSLVILMLVAIIEDNIRLATEIETFIDKRLRDMEVEEVIKRPM